MDPNGRQLIDQGTADDPVVAANAGGKYYLNIRLSRLRELQRQDRIQQELETEAAIASNPVSAILWGISRLLTKDPNKQHAAAQLGVATFGVAAGLGGTLAARQQRQSLTSTPPLPDAAETARPESEVTAANQPSPAVPPRGLPSSEVLPLSASPPRAVDVLVVGAETSAEFEFARKVAGAGGNVVVANPMATEAARAYQQSGGTFFQGRIEDLPTGARFNLISEDYPFPLGPVLSPSQQFIEARLARLKTGGTWVLITESSDFAQALEIAGSLANARVTVYQTPLAHEATPQSAYPREHSRFVLTFSK